ncbi:MAG: UvrD-helicase domain-containing protein [Desulfobacula sp.]|nr:UvrD-helicase domain-containing protein [Desulfobacula sp.]
MYDNPFQLELLKLLITENQKNSSFWVCGDDHQSIYGFTGASVGNILNLKPCSLYQSSSFLS